MNDRSRLRLVILAALVFSLPITLLGRLWYMQALAGAQYAAAAQHNVTGKVGLIAPRGLIVDDVGNPLARNDSVLVVSALSTELPKSNIGTDKKPKANPARIAEMQRLSAILGVKASDLDAKATLCDYRKYGSAAPTKNPGCWIGSPLQPIPLVSLDNSTPAATQHATQVALQVLEEPELFPGITAQTEQARDYPAPDGASAAQILGHVGKITQADIQNTKDPAESKFLSAAAGLGGVVGQEGLEAEYNTYLQGTMGSRTFSLDQSGQPQQTLSETPARPGDEVVTSIDARVQQIAEQAIADAVNHAHTVKQRISGGLKTQKADVAAAVVLDARTGHVIALANYPTYNPGVWNGTGIDPKTYNQLKTEAGNPLFSQAVQGQYAPGSTFKVVTTAGAITTPQYSLNGQYECPANIKIGKQTFRNFDGEAGTTAKITFADALKISCDTYFYSIAQNLWNADGGLHPTHPRDAIINEAKVWGIGTNSGIDLPIGTASAVQTRQDLKNYVYRNQSLFCAQASTEKDPTIRGDDETACKYPEIASEYQVGQALNVALGQGTVTMSPLQVAINYAAIANGGTVFSPRIGKAVVGPDGKLVQTIDAPTHKLNVPANVLDYLRNALSSVVSDPKGTAYASFQGFPLDRYAVSGKTGTAEVQSLNPDGSKKDDTAWFASFGGPVGQPAQYAIVVMVSQGGQGGITAAPAVRQIYDGIWGLDNPDPKLPNDKFAAKGPALPDGAPPLNLPKFSFVVSPSASASSSASPTATPTSGAAASAAFAPATTGGARGLDVALPLAEPATRPPHARASGP